MKNIFLLLSIIGFPIFVYMDFTGSDSTTIKYIEIILIALYSLFLAIKHCEKKRWFHFIIRLLVVVADLFLLVKNDNYEIGVGLFCLIETCYCILIQNKKTVAVRIGIFAGLLIVVKMLNMVSLLNVLCIYNITMLFMNVVDASIQKDKKIFLGFLLFLICDIWVGLANLNILLPYAYYISWIAYYPAQVLLILGDFDYEKK